jgi:predicted AAA+ superfamily ATPase
LLLKSVSVRFFDTKSILVRAHGLALLRGVVDSPAVREFLALLELLEKGTPDPASVAEVYGRLWRELAQAPEKLLPDAWRSYLVQRILDDENPFSLGAERGNLYPALVEQTRRELRLLQALFGIESEKLLGAVEEAAPELSELWATPGFEVPSEPSPRREVARLLAGSRDWGEGTGELAEYFARHGAGAFGGHAAFRWREGRLSTVPSPDPARLSGLVGYERERGPLVENTKRFVAGLPAHHALLYGPPGTGKSSTVKAVANEYAGRGLKVVEVAKEDLRELPLVLDGLRDRGPRFVLFVDDLSFEEHEVEYKALKALLEGSIEEPPGNVRVYATSNRRNLIRENFSDRGELGDDVHARDTMQEKLSLSARFGLRLTFPAPDQRRYLEIVAGLVRERGMEVSEEELRERALLWDRWHAGRSGRTARQFVDELQAELGS